MIVRQFLQWVRTAEAAERAEATSALARAYLYSDLTPDDRAAAEGAMILLLDDPSPLVRFALADALGASADAPAAVVHALVNDQPDIAVVRAGALAAAARLRSGRFRRGRRRAHAERDRAARDAAARGLGRDRRSRLGGSVPDADRERQRRHRGILALAHRAALRPSRGDPRGAACLGRPAGRDPAHAGGQAVRDACGLRGRVPLDGRGQGAAHRAGGLREGDRDPRGRIRCVAAGRSFARDRSAHRGSGAALLALRQRRLLRAVAGRTGGSARRARQRAAA